MPYEPLAPSLRRALTTLAGPDPFTQTALLRLYRHQADLLDTRTRTTLERAEALDQRAPALRHDEQD